MIVRGLKLGLGLCLVAALVLLVSSRTMSGSFFNGEEKTTVTHNRLIEQIERIGKLELVKVHIKDVVEVKNQRAWYKGGDSRLLLVVSGEAAGCIDLNAIKAEHISIDEDSIRITLPAPEICYFKIDHQNSRVYEGENQFKLLSYNDASQETAEAFKMAETELKQTALEMGIEAQTKENAIKVLKPLLQRVSGKPISIR